MGMNGVAVARNGPRLWENGATGSRKVFKYLLGLWEAIKKSKNGRKHGNKEIVTNAAESLTCYTSVHD